MKMQVVEIIKVVKMHANIQFKVYLIRKTQPKKACGLIPKKICLHTQSSGTDNLQTYPVSLQFCKQNIATGNKHKTKSFRPHTRRRPNTWKNPYGFSAGVGAGARAGGRNVKEKSCEFLSRRHKFYSQRDLVRRLPPAPRAPPRLRPAGVRLLVIVKIIAPLSTEALNICPRHVVMPTTRSEVKYDASLGVL